MSGKRERGEDAPIVFVVVVHKAVRKERIRPYRRPVPVSRETSWRGPAGSRRAFAKGEARRVHMHVHDAYGSRAPEVAGAAKELSSRDEMILLLRCAAARAFNVSSSLGRD